MTDREKLSEIAAIKSALPKRAGWDHATISLTRKTARGSYFATDVGNEWLVWCSSKPDQPTMIGYFESIEAADAGIAKFEAEDADYIGPTNVDADGREVA